MQKQKASDHTFGKEYNSKLLLDHKAILRLSVARLLLANRSLVCVLENHCSLIPSLVRTTVGVASNLKSFRNMVVCDPSVKYFGLQKFLSFHTACVL